MVGQKFVERFDLKFKKLSVYARMEFARICNKERRDSLVARLNEINATREERMAELDAFDDAPVQNSDFYRYFFSLPGQIQILAHSLKSEYGEKCVEVLADLAITEDEQMQLVADIAGVDLEKIKAATNAAQQQAQAAAPNDPTAADAPSYGNPGPNPQAGGTAGAQAGGTAPAPDPSYPAV